MSERLPTISVHMHCTACGGSGLLGGMLCHCMPDFEPYDVTCVRCGKVLSCVDAVPEEGDEWECVPCNDRCNAQERATRQVKT